ncbi:DUF418 domain-containing protein [Pseudomonas chlororaphis]|uniref:DUF418 domain-containing protein n=1 Tax=Pseudomonas chlororaphis TaxID=587753 RepID=UPI002368EAB2|nr:DUF418 domain-containing protein [Pseudomonas chlororaphis]WDH36485.1 DUF418 domain-containing protein [Pseudomonas chlororaphis]WDH42570.1 DUF418 domain-containing protein [Pseudomonas chlororaphis]
MNSPAHPGLEKITSATRLLHIDALRGFALLGILAVNIWVFTDPYYGASVSNPAYPAAIDHAIRFLISTLFETKFYLLFSFLFGYSFTLQLASAQRSQNAFVPRMVRRQLALLAIGLIHGAVLFYGEILSLYAVLGLVLLGLRNLCPRRALKLAVGLLVCSALIFMALGLLQLAEGNYVGSMEWELVDKAFLLGSSALGTLSFNLSHLPETILALWLLQGPSTLAMFLFGYVAGRRGWLVAPYVFDAWKDRLLSLMLPIGLGGALIYGYTAAYAPGAGLEALGYGIGQLTAPLLTASYVLLLLGAFNSPLGERVCRLLAPMGRMSLSNYLLQSLLLSLIFTGYGLGLINLLGSAWILLIVIALYALQLWLSTLWMRSHQYGPCEWLLRAVTLLAWPAWRKTR